MRMDPGEFRACPLRVHALLHDVPLEAVWAIRLPGGGAGRTIQDVRAVFIAGVEAAPPIVKGLFRLRGRLGACSGGISSVLRGTPNPTCIVSAQQIVPSQRPLRGHRTDDSASSTGLRMSS